MRLVEIRRGAALLAVAACLLAGPSKAQEPSVGALVETIRFHPASKAARLAIGCLADAGEPGWKALGVLIDELETSHGEIALVAADALAGGDERARLEVLRSTYPRVRAEGLAAKLVRGLARGYPANAALLHRCLRENRSGAAELVPLLARRGLPDEELTRCLEHGTLARAAYDALRARGSRLRPDQLASLAGAEAQLGLSPATCRAFAAAAPDFVLLRALASLLNDGTDDDVRIGAHCLLLTVSGRDLPADPLVWRSWLEDRESRYERPRAGFSKGTVAAAVARGARFLRRDLAEDGCCIWRSGSKRDTVGTTALATLALRASAVPADDPALRKALETTLLVLDRGGRPGLPALDRARETYGLSLLAMALEALDARAYREPLQAIGNRLTRGMLQNGQWTYACSWGTGQKRPATGDNSNTQYALLGLRAARRAGATLEREAWERAERFWRTTVNGHGGWGYRPAGKHATTRQISMTSAGLSSLAICTEALHGGRAMERIATDAAIRRALRYLGSQLFERGYRKAELYAWYGVERACVLTGTAAFQGGPHEFDWYREGARILLAGQAENGSWGNPKAKSDVRGSGYGPVIDTAYALLFLRRATTAIGKAAGPGRVPAIAPPGFKPTPADLPQAAPPPPPPPPEPPLLTLDCERIETRDGAITLGGRLRAPGAARVTVDGAPVETDADGRFETALQAEGSRLVEVVATPPEGSPFRRIVSIVLDEEPPALELVGPSLRHVGRQVLEFSSSDPDLAHIWLGGRVYPARERIATATVDIREGRQNLTVIAVDRAGNRARHAFPIEAANRALVLDGKSAVRIDLRRRPLPFTYECWVRGSEPTGTVTVSADTEGAGFGIHWSSKGRPLPYATARGTHAYTYVAARRAWRWSAWTHLALTYDGAMLRFFVNGKLQGEAAGKGYRRSTRSLYIGAEPDSKNRARQFWRGEVDEVRLSSVVRYERNFRPEKHFLRDRDTVLLLHFDTDTPTAFLDDSGSHQHGRPVGSPQPRPVRR